MRLLHHTTTLLISKGREGLLSIPSAHYHWLVVSTNNDQKYKKGAKLKQPDLLRISRIILSYPLVDCFELQGLLGLCSQNINKYSNKPAKGYEKIIFRSTNFTIFNPLWSPTHQQYITKNWMFGEDGGATYYIYRTRSAHTLFLNITKERSLKHLVL